MCKQNILAAFKTIRPNVDGIVSFEQSNEGQEQTTVEERYARY